MNKFFKIFLLIMFTIFTSNSNADVPQIITYQGVLNNSDGTPSNGTYQFRFRIYDASVGGNELWDSQVRSVEVVDGIFTYFLGENVTIPKNFFIVNPIAFLGVQVGSDAEMTPRGLLTSSPYSFQSGVSDSAVVAGEVQWNAIQNRPAGLDDGDDGISQVESDNLYARKLNSLLYGDIIVSNESDNKLTYRFNANQNTFEMYDFGSDNDYRLLEMTTFSGGEMRMYWNADTSKSLVNIEATPNGGEIALQNNAGNTTIFFRGQGSSYLNNDRVVVHEDGIDDIEILNEPGIAQERTNNCLSLTSTGSMVDITTVDITIPAPGYIFLTAHAIAELSGVTNGNRVKAQIDETAGGSALNGYYSRVGLSGYVSTSFCDFDLNCQRTYYKTEVGTYTFRFEAVKENTEANANICFATLTATYFPTSYGTVTTVSADSTASGSENEKATSKIQFDNELLHLNELEKSEKESRRNRSLESINDN